MDGIILINKEKEYTSHDVVNKVKKILNSKVGHTGTLDPNATGVLPLLIGNATKISKYLIEHDKEYEVLLKLGIKTDSADGEGNIIAEDDFKLKKENEENYYHVFEKIVGKHIQVPPMYSAIKVNGKKLYEYARAGQEIEREGREIEIYSIGIEKTSIYPYDSAYRYGVLSIPKRSAYSSILYYANIASLFAIMYGSNDTESLPEDVNIMVADSHW